MVVGMWYRQRVFVVGLLLLVMLSLGILLQFGKDQDTILPKNIFGYSLETWDRSSGDKSWYHQVELNAEKEAAEKHAGQHEPSQAETTSPDQDGKDDDQGQQENTSNPNDASGSDDGQTDPHVPAAVNHRLLKSVSSPDQKFWKLDLKGSKGYNANVIPHPTNSSQWIVVLQHEQFDEDITVSEELACNAAFVDGFLACQEPPTVLPIEPSITGVCEGDLAYANFRRGPRDARMFYGPDAPYIMYGSQSSYICFSLWMQDLRPMLDAFPYGRYVTIDKFKTLTELKRPSNYHVVEKNYFVFWDSQNVPYAHYDISPKRAFARLDNNGTGIEDLAPLSRDTDEKCMNRYMPKVAPKQESIHQATNSLSITNCSRYDTECVADDSNTFIMHIFHYKTYYNFHGLYEPYVFLFQRTAPFAAHAIAQRPYWINGRGNLTTESDSVQYRKHPEWIPEGDTEFFYITSMSWKNHGQTYHGYIDDVLFLTFGIEDSRGGAMDVVAGDLLQDLAYC